MQIFITGSPFETAQVLDKRRLNKQIIECLQIMKAIKGESKAWLNHPCVKMYREHLDWLKNYFGTLDDFRDGHIEHAKFFSFLADKFRPHFHTQEYFNQMKRRLFTKDNEYYKQWLHLGESDVNWYYVDGEWRYYRGGKRIASVSGE